MLSCITKWAALRRLRNSLEQEFDHAHVKSMVKRARKYSTNDIDRVADAIERFGAQNVFLSIGSYFSPWSP